jgi:CRISPR-associated endonuclease Csn1
VQKLKSKDIPFIVDPVIRARVVARLNEIGGEPQQVFKSDENLPFVERGDGSRVLIRRVRVRRNYKTVEVGTAPGARHIQSGNNHHIEIVGRVSEHNTVTRWEGHLVSLLEACRRVADGEPIVRRDHGEQRRFLFSLSNGEIIELDDHRGGKGLFKIRTVSDRLLFFPINDARKKDVVKKADTFAGLTANAESLRKRNCRKVLVTPLGEVRWAND